jgi:hypothetical protein
MQQQTPVNFSDYALVYGSQACALLAGYLTLDEGPLEVLIAASDGLIMATAMLLVGLIIIRQPPGIIRRVLRGEPIDNIKSPPDDR